MLTELEMSRQQAIACYRLVFHSKINFMEENYAWFLYQDSVKSCELKSFFCIKLGQLVVRLFLWSHLKKSVLTGKYVSSHSLVELA